MSPLRSALLSLALVLGTVSGGCMSMGSTAASRSNLTAESTQALDSLYATNPAARAISEKARVVLVFPKMIKAGLGLGGAYGDGELRRGSTVLGRYNSVTASWGLQAGAQSYGYAVFLMTPEAEEYVNRSDGWEIGVGPTVVVVNEGVAQNLSTTTLKDDAYAFIFDQTGLMAGVSIEGTKVTRLRN